MTYTLFVLVKKYSILKFHPEAVLPDWIYSSDFYSVTKTEEEISVVTAQTENISDKIVSSKDWRILKIEGQLDFSLTGVIADIAAILKKNKISIFTISTYNTDYILVKENDLEISVKALRENDYDIRQGN
jgi:uncharacterized protein